MEEELMFMIKNKLAEMRHNGYEISEIQMFQNISNHWVVSYVYNNSKHIICSDRIN